MRILYKEHVRVGTAIRAAWFLFGVRLWIIKS